MRACGVRVVRAASSTFLHRLAAGIMLVRRSGVVSRGTNREAWRRRGGDNISIIV